MSEYDDLKLLRHNLTQTHDPERRDRAISEVITHLRYETAGRERAEHNLGVATGEIDRLTARLRAAERVVEAARVLRPQLEAMDRQARDPGYRHMVEVTTELWRDVIAPNIAALTRALDMAGTPE